jgi:hypothetical protein
MPQVAEAVLRRRPIQITAAAPILQVGSEHQADWHCFSDRFGQALGEIWQCWLAC